MSEEPTLSFSQFSSTSDVHHPSEPVAKFDSFQEPLINKLYVAQILRELFSDNDTGVGALLDRWVDDKGSVFGVGCDIYSSDGNRNCGGDASGANAPPRTGPTVMRELYRLKICNDLIGVNRAPESALAQADLLPTTALATPENLSKVFRLFYRIQDPSIYEINTFIDLDKNLADAGLNQKERWRAILITICESTGWQQF